MFNTRLSYLRKKKNLNQEEMAKKIGVARTTYAMYEQGRRSPDFETLQKIARYFMVTTDYLLGMVDDPHAVDPAAEEVFQDPKTNLMFSDWKNFTDEQKDEVLEILKYVKYKNKEKETEGE